MRQTLALLLLASCTGAPPGDHDPVDCTQIGCSSSFELSLTHDLPLDGAQVHSVVLAAAPVGTVTCSVGPATDGTDSCFGFRFADVAWTPDTITITLVRPFFVSDETPDGEPFASYDLRVEQAGSTVFAESFPTGEVEPLQPNGPECGPICYQVARAHDVRSE